MLVVLDTNILVSALLSPFGPPARVLDLILTGANAWNNLTTWGGARVDDWARLLSECWGLTQPRVRIPPSPPDKLLG